VQIAALSMLVGYAWIELFHATAALTPR